MSWLLAFIVIAIIVAALVCGTVLHPVLYGLFIAAVLVIPVWLGSSIINGIIESIFGKRR